MYCQVVYGQLFSWSGKEKIETFGVWRGHSCTTERVYSAGVSPRSVGQMSMHASFVHGSLETFE